MPITWTNGKPEDVFGAGYNKYQQQLRSAILQLLAARQPEITEWMQSNAPWTDRTGNARRGLNVDIEAFADGIMLILQHGVTYGIYLELKNSGRYAILTPALDYWGPVILKDLEDLIK